MPGVVQDVQNIQGGKHSCQVEIVESSRDFRSLLPEEFAVSGAYGTRDGVEAPHSIIYVPRAGELLKSCLCVQLYLIG